MANDIVIKPARHSALSSLTVRLAVVDYQLIGTYEDTHPARVLAMLRSFLLNGYNGPAISVIESQADTIYRSLPEGKPTAVTLDKYGRLGIADGHHRLAAIMLLGKLGLLGWPEIPVQVLPMREQGIAKIVTAEIGDRPLSPREKPLTISDLEQCFSHPGKMIPPNLTVHVDVKFNDGTYNWVRFAQPDVIIERSDFLTHQSKLDMLAQIIDGHEFQPTRKQSQAMLDKTVAKFTEIIGKTPST